MFHVKQFSAILMFIVVIIALKLNERAAINRFYDFQQKSKL